MSKLAALAGTVLAAALMQSSGAHALTTKECSAKYKAAKSAGTLNGMKWNEFRKAQCSAQAANEPAPNASAPSPHQSLNSTARTAPMPRGNAVFPTAVSPKYANESAGKARMHTCLDQYNANKSTGGNGGLKWIEKGDGYYSECNSRLKGRG
jgi:hypothetical protein